MIHGNSETQKFISNIATRMESSHYGSLHGDYITEAYIGEALGGRVDEGFVDVVKAIGVAIPYEKSSIGLPVFGSRWTPGSPSSETE